ncbi:MAG: hypothetical protein EHM13_14700 [Acidobacteria bacterium]|nr:MAG: hypothetical protein EHM13_14700 [Acidobacteriota bacterium]
MIALQPLLSRLVDYAGLFPPAQLTMHAAVQRYADHRRGEHSWMLNRFIVPIARLGEFDQAFSSLPGEEEENVGEPWRISAIGGRGPDSDLRAILDFNRRHGEAGRPAVIEAIELKVLSRQELEPAADLASEPLEVYAEVPAATDPDAWIAAAADAGLRVKVRAGGVTPEMFPPAADLARFLSTCARRKVGFKATAGLHHALRGERPLSDDPSAARVLMHGFLNVFLAASLAYTCGITTEQVENVLEERSIKAFEFGEDGVAWRGRRVTSADFAAVRRSFAIAYGSCSFGQPVADLTDLGLLRNASVGE